MKTGIDVSSYQGEIDFGQVAREVAFVFAKASEGVSFVDDRFAANHDGAKGAGIAFGAYHFLRFNVDPHEQAAHFLSTIDGRAGTLLPMVDVEVTDGADAKTLLTSIDAFMADVEKTLGGKRMLLYTYYGFWEESMAGSSAFSGHPLWIAEYNSDAEPSLPAGFDRWVIWQYSSKGAVKGIEGDVDMDRLNGDDLSVISR